MLSSGSVTGGSGSITGGSGSITGGSGSITGGSGSITGSSGSVIGISILDGSYSIGSPSAVQKGTNVSVVTGSGYPDFSVRLLDSKHL